MSKDIVNHPWGQSVDWSKGNRVSGYTPSRWLSGVPVTRRGGHFQGARSVASSDVSTSVLGSSSGPSSGSFLGYPGASTAGFVSSPDTQTEQRLQKEIDYSKWFYVGSIVLLSIGSIGSLIIAYKTYQINKRDSEIKNGRY